MIIASVLYKLYYLDESGVNQSSHNRPSPHPELRKLAGRDGGAAGKCRPNTGSERGETEEV